MTGEVRDRGGSGPHGGDGGGGREPHGDGGGRGLDGDGDGGGSGPHGDGDGDGRPYGAEEADEAHRRLREICGALPETSERLSHGSPSWFVREKKSLVKLVDDHHGDGRLAIWCPAPPGIQGELVSQEPERFFVPPYVGPSGWVGLRLDVDVDWDEVAGIVEDAYRHVAPKRLVARLDDGD